VCFFCVCVWNFLFFNICDGRDVLKVLSFLTAPDHTKHNESRLRHSFQQRTLRVHQMAGNKKNKAFKTGCSDDLMTTNLRTI
jgi:hypothetical protein